MTVNTAMNCGSATPDLLVLGGPPSFTGPAADLVRGVLHAGRRRGLRVTVADTGVGLAAAAGLCPDVDATAEVDFMRPDDCVAWAADRSIDVVYSIREYAQIAAAEVAAARSVPGNPPHAVRRVRSKDTCRARLAATGFAQPRFQVCTDAGEAAAFLDRSSGPWIVKPRDAMGSQGVTLVTGRDNLPAALGAIPAGQPCIVEEFVHGPEYSVEGLFVGGRPEVLTVTAKDLVGDGRFVELGHVLPAPISDDLAVRIRRQVTDALLALELRFGVFHVELWATAAGIVLGEVHVRPGGDWIHLMLAHTRPGLDLFGAVFDDALGRPVTIPAAAPGRAAAVRYLVASPGVVTDITGWDAVAAHPAVLHAELSVRTGDPVRPLLDSFDRVGVVVVGADTAQRARAIAVDLAGRVRITTDGPSETVPAYCGAGTG